MSGSSAAKLMAPQPSVNVQYLFVSPSSMCSWPSCSCRSSVHACSATSSMVAPPVVVEARVLFTARGGPEEAGEAVPKSWPWRAVEPRPGGRDEWVFFSAYRC